MAIVHYAFRLSLERLRDSIADLGSEPQIAIDRPSRTALWREQLSRDGQTQKLMAEFGGWDAATLTDTLRSGSSETKTDLVANLLFFGAVLRGEGMGFGLGASWRAAIKSGLDERLVFGHKFADTSLIRPSAAGGDAGSALRAFFADVRPLSTSSSFGFLESEDRAIAASEKSKSELSYPILHYVNGIAESLSKGIGVLLVLSG